MGGYPFSEMSCKICSKAVDLCVDLYADEIGKVVHEHCYVTQITRLETRTLRIQWQQSEIGGGPSLA
jgi:hypothetical protein